MVEENVTVVVETFCWAFEAILNKAITSKKKKDCLMAINMKLVNDAFS